MTRVVEPLRQTMHHTATVAIPLSTAQHHLQHVCRVETGNVICSTYIECWVVVLGVGSVLLCKVTCTDGTDKRGI